MLFTPSTTNNSPQTYWLALLARNTTGPAKSAGSPHLPAGMRSEIWRRRTGSARSFSFLHSDRLIIIRIGEDRSSARQKPDNDEIQDKTRGNDAAEP